MTIQHGLTDGGRFAAAREAEQIDTVIAAFPDLYGRLVGKRFDASYFCDAVVGGRDSRLRLPVDRRHGNGAGAGLRIGQLAQRLWRRPSRARFGDAAQGHLAGKDGAGAVRRARDEIRSNCCRTHHGRCCDCRSRPPKELGFDALAGSEVEYFIFKDTYRRGHVASFCGTPDSRFDLHRRLSHSAGYA